MLLRWWHERVRYKPWRPAVQCMLGGWAAVVGWSGATLTRLWRTVRRCPPAPALESLAAQRILCLRPDRLGDVVLLTPALMALRARFPQAAVTLLASEAVRPVVAGHPAVTDVVTVRGDRWLDLWHDRDTLRRLRTQAYDVVIVFESAWSCALLAWWLGVPVRLGYDVRGMGFLLSHALPYPYARVKVHQVVVNARLVTAVGGSEATATGPLHVPVAAAARAEARSWLRAQGVGDGDRVVLVHPGSRSRYTQWEPARFGAVAEWLHQQPAVRVIVLCGPGEEAIVARMQRAMSWVPLVAQGWSLERVMGLMSQCQVFVGNATGTAQLAAAAGARVVQIIGGTHPLDCPERWRPWGQGHAVVHTTPLEAIGRDTTAWLGPEGLAHITPMDVIRTLEALLPQVAHG